MSSSFEQTCRSDERSFALACPLCGKPGASVAPPTVRALIAACRRDRVDPEADYRFCANPACELVYFVGTAPGEVARKNDLRVRVGVKETDDSAPLCYCFRFTRKHIRDEAVAGRTSIISEVRRRVRQRECACETENPSGRCCLGDLAREAKLARSAKGAR